MRTILFSSIALFLVFSGCATQPPPGAATPKADASFFNGKNLTGWSGPMMEYWSVEDGAIVGKSAKRVPRNEFIWSNIEVRDFYLSVDVKLDPDSSNGGIQFRSQKLPPNEALGYQADMGKGVWGRLYHESGRKKLDWRERGEAAVKPGEWNRYEILAVGHRIWTALNGKLAVSVNDPEGELAGYIALQMHAGVPMDVRYRIRELVHNPKVELIGLNEAQLNAELIAPEKDPTAGTRPVTQPTSRPTTRRAGAGARPSSADLSSESNGPPEAKSGPEFKPGEDARAPKAVAAATLPAVTEPAEKRFGRPPAVAIASPAAPFADGKFALRDGEVIVFAGQTNIVRAQQSGDLEALLAVAFANRKPLFRSMGWEGDTVYQQWRDLNFGGWRDQLAWVGASAVIAQFGQTESLDGPAKLPEFAAAYGKLLDEWSAITRRIVLISPMPFEKPPSSLMPDLSRRNDDVRAYASAIKQLAAERGLIFVDLITPLDGKTDNDLAAGRLTSNGMHLTAAGQRLVATIIARQLGVDVKASPDRLDPLRQAIVEKNQLWFENWRPMNWAFAYGDRQHVPFSHEIGEHPPLPIEFEEFKPLVEKADGKIHDLAVAAVAK